VKREKLELYGETPRGILVAPGQNNGNEGVWTETQQEEGRKGKEKRPTAALEEGRKAKDLQETL